MSMHQTRAERAAFKPAVAVITCIVLWVIVVLCAGCAPRAAWYLDVVATDGGEPGEASVTIDTVWGRTDWSMSNGILYVGDDSEVVRHVWGSGERAVEAPEVDEEVETPITEPTP
jgi:hypothetical protein